MEPAETRPGPFSRVRSAASRAIASARALFSRASSKLPWARSDTSNLDLQPLTPKFIPEQHQTYSDELVSLLRDRKRRRLVWNIALTGGYGSGKSSVLAAVRNRLPRRVVEVSLSSLSDVGVVSGEPGQDLNNYIQKEIVKQLLYRERPNRVPSSRFRRISRLPFWRTLMVSLAAGVLGSGLLWLTGWGAPFADPNLQSDQRILLLVAIGAGLACLTFVVHVLFHNRVRIDKLGTAATSVSLAPDATTSFFDEYLDEIVYFFEMTRRDVVIIEDLDRFEDPTIYASLRALNTVLNASRQLRRRPVHFVYAVRDSIFEDLEVLQKPADGQDEPSATVVPAEKGVWQADRSKSDAPTQRTKFFDLVIPIVPFITHRNARDLLTDVMIEIDPAVSTEVVRVVARHVTDMRLLRNMANEYRVFYKRVIAPGKLIGLTSRGLFAMVAYKNTHLNDFELIRVGESSLDKLYRLSREVIDEGLEAVAKQIVALESTSDPVAATVARAEQLGASLQNLLDRWLALLGAAGLQAQLRLNGVDRPTAEIVTTEFWAEVIDGGTSIEVWVRGEEKFRLDAAAIRAEFGALVPDQWAAADRTEHRQQLEALRGQHTWFRSADFQRLVSPIRPLTHNGVPVEFTKLIKKELEDPLLRDLVVDGHIDRNFLLYSSEFYGVVATANAMTFVTQHVNAEVPAHAYELSPAEVEMVIREADRGVFESVGMYNLAVYDGLLANDDPRLERNISLLASGRPIDLEFLTKYVAEGAHPDDLVRRLSQYWDGIFDFVAKIEESEIRPRLAIAAFDGGDPSREYAINDDLQKSIADGYKSIDDLKNDARSPDRAVQLLRRLGIRLPSLEGLTPLARVAVAQARQYVVTRDTLRTVLGNDAVELDSILATDENTFNHLVFHVDEYLKALLESKPPADSISSADALVPVVDAIERHSAGTALPVLKRAGKDLQVPDLTDVPSNVMGVLAEGQRFAVTAANLQLYVDARSLDAELIPVLEAAKQVATPADFDSASRTKLAIQVVNEAKLSVEARISLVKSLVDAPLEMRRVSSRDPKLIEKLVARALIEDNATSFDLLSGSPECQEAFIAGSPSFASYFDQLAKTESTMGFLARSTALPDQLKSRMLADLPSEPQFATALVVDGLIDWAFASGVTVPPETLTTVLTSPASIENKVRVAAQAASTHSRPQVEDFLRHIGEPYSLLTARGARGVILPVEPDPTALLAVLKDDPDAAVSSWDVTKEQVQVWLRKPIE